jgi:hypothetical protein
MANTFHPFPNLPTELRLAIWSTILDNSPRILTLPASDKLHSPLTPHYPIIYMVNKEARSVVTAMGYEARLFPTFTTKPTLMNFKTDTIFIESGHTAMSLRWIFNDEVIMRNLRFLALDWSVWQGVCENGSYEGVFEDLMLLSALEKITFVITEEVFADEEPDPITGKFGENIYGYNEVVGFRQLGWRQEDADRDVQQWVEHSYSRPMRLAQWLQEQERGGWVAPKVEARGVNRIGRRWASREEIEEKRAKMMRAWEQRKMEVLKTSRYMALLYPNGS